MWGILALPLDTHPLESLQFIAFIYRSFKTLFYEMLKMGKYAYLWEGYVKIFLGCMQKISAPYLVYFLKIAWF